MYAAAGAVALGLVIATSLFHYEMLERLGIWTVRRRRAGRSLTVIALSALVLVHIVEICAYAGAFALAESAGWGSLVKEDLAKDAFFYVYFSAETYSTLGYGDIAPAGLLRMIAAVESLNGLLLIAWSGAFLFSLVRSDVAAEVRRGPESRNS
jgi:hypothetical protein